MSTGLGQYRENGLPEGDTLNEDRRGEGDDEVEEAGRGGGSSSVQGRPIAGVPSRPGGSGERDVPGCSHHGAEG